MERDRLLERVRALLAKAEDQAGTPEGEMFAAKAEELMIRHGIEQAVLDAQKGDDLGEIGETRIWCPAPYAKQKAGIVCAASHYNQCHGVIIEPRSWGKGCHVAVYGYEQDRDTVEFLVTSLLLQAVQALGKEQIPVRWDGRSEDPASYRASWLMGFRSGVESRMREMQRQATEDYKSSGAELVLINKQDRINQWITENVSGLKSIRTTSSGSGRGAGYRAGRNADLGQNRFSGAKKQITH